jgi:hypothetical protein
VTDLERRLRRIVGIVWMLGAAGAIVGLFPGERVYDDANNCFGSAIAGLFLHGGDHGCTASYTKLVAERPAGGLPMVLFVGAIAAYGWLLVRHPRRWVAAAWGLWTAVALVAFFAATFKLDLFSHTETLWATPVAYTLVGAMLLLIFPIAPIVAFASRRDDRADAPSARLVVR